MQNIVILGNQAIGKTTLLKFYVLNLLEKKHFTSFPIMIYLREYSSRVNLDNALSIAKFIDQFISNSMNLSENYILKHLERGSCCIILDGLDEAIDLKTRILITRKIEQFVALYGNNKVHNYFK